MGADRGERRPAARLGLGSWDIDLLMGVPGRSSGDGQREPTCVKRAGTAAGSSRDAFLLVDVLIVFLFGFPANWDASYARPDLPAISQPPNGALSPQLR
jgi:hypothetical protein